MNATTENIFESGVNISEDFTANSSASANYIPANHMLLNTIFGRFYNGSSSTEAFINSTEDANKSLQYSESTSFQESQEYSVFSEYPRGLLCFGAICFILFAIVGVLGNFVSILALSKCQRLRNATTAFIVNLCVADLLFCSFSMPLSALTFIEEKWYYGDVLCKLFPLVRYSNGAVSLFSVIAITINRYILIVHPKIYSAVYTKRNMVIMISLIWVSSVLILLPPLLGVWGTLGYDRDVGTCTILKLNGKSPKMFLYITAFGVPSIIFVFCYLRIFFVVRKASKKTRSSESVVPTNISFKARKGFVSKIYRHSEMPENNAYAEQRQKNELRVLRVMLVIFVLFILCYFPVSFVKIFHKEDKLHIMNVFGYLGVYFSNIVNPIIYIVMSKEYRRAYKDLFCNTAKK